MAQPALGRPLGERHLGHELGADPPRGAHDRPRRLGARNGHDVGGEVVELGLQPASSAAVKPVPTLPAYTSGPSGSSSWW